MYHLKRCAQAIFHNRQAVLSATDQLVSALAMFHIFVQLMCVTITNLLRKFVLLTYVARVHLYFPVVLLLVII